MHVCINAALEGPACKLDASIVTNVIALQETWTLGQFDAEGRSTHTGDYYGSRRRRARSTGDSTDHSGGGSRSESRDKWSPSWHSTTRDRSGQHHMQLSRERCGPQTANAVAMQQQLSLQHRLQEDPQLAQEAALPLRQQQNMRHAASASTDDCGDAFGDSPGLGFAM